MSENVQRFPLDTRERELQQAIKQLEYLTAQLRFMSSLTVSLTGLSFLIFFGVRFFETLGMRLIPPAAFLATLTVPICSLLILIRFDSLKRKGNVVFKELSDELQWYVRYEPTRGGSEPNAESRPELRTRIVLRQYVASTTLPLVPSDLGPAIYAIANISLALAALFLLRL